MTSCKNRCKLSLGPGLACSCTGVLVKAVERALSDLDNHGGTKETNEGGDVTIDGGARGRDQLQGRSWRTARPRNHCCEQSGSFATPQDCGQRSVALVVVRSFCSRTAPRNVRSDESHSR